MITTRNLKTECSVSKGSASNITDALGYSTVCTRVGSTKLNNHNYAKRGADIRSPVTRLTERFLSWIHHFELRKTLTGIVSCTFSEEGNGYSFNRESHSDSFWEGEEVILVDIMPHC